MTRLPAFQNASTPRQVDDIAAQNAWPRLMRAETAARYVDERSIQTFRRSVGKVYPRPIRISGKGERWLKDHLDQAISRLFGSAGTVFDIADAL